MADTIRMSPDTMRTRASEYATEAANIQQIIDKLDRLLGQLQQEWEGESSRAYAEKFSKLRPGFVQTKETVDEISAALKKTANIVEERDREIAMQYRQ